MARWRSDLLSYNRMEPSPGADPGGTPIPRASGRRSEGHRFGSWTRTSVRLLQRQSGMPATHPGMSWSPRQLPPLAESPYKGSRSLARGRSVLGATRTRTAQTLILVPPAVGLRGQESRHPGSNRAIRRTKAKPQAVRGGMASGAGVEPTGAWFRAMLGCRQPTRNRYGRRESNAQAARFELARSAEIAVTPACAARGSNPVPLGKSQLHHHNACSAQSLPVNGELNPARRLGRLAHRH